VSTDQTTFEIALTGPSLDDPLLFDVHAQRIEACLREHHPSSAGYRVSASKETIGNRRRWEISLRRGWLSGARVILRPLPEASHRARVTVEWDSRLASALIIGLGATGVPIGLVALVALVAAILRLQRIFLSLLLVCVLAAVWIFVACIVGTLAARAVAAVTHNEFNETRRAQIAEHLRALPVVTHLQRESGTPDSCK
jgi:hypothetical protein